MKIFPDENLVKHPINSAMAYSWAAMNGSWKNTVIVALALIILTFLQLIPIIGIFFGVLQSIVLYAMGYWIADRLRSSTDVESFKERMPNESERSITFDFFAPAAGFYLGFMIFSVIMVLITVAILWLTGGFEVVTHIQHPPGPGATPEQITEFYMQIVSAGTPAIMFILVTSLFFSYLWPVVYGYALQQRTFGDALNSVFMFFSTKFWKAAFTGSYFKLVSLWMLILLGVGFLMGFTLVTLILFPVFILLLMWMAYFTSTVSAAAYNMCDDI